jgi:small membrane protein
MEIIQIVIIIFALFAWSRSMLRWKDKSLNLKELSFWSLVWLLVIVVAVLPQSVGFLRLFGASAFNVLVMLSILMLFYLIFRMYVKIDKLEQEITVLVREIAKK